MNSEAIIEQEFKNTEKHLHHGIEAFRLESQLQSMAIERLATVQDAEVRKTLHDLFPPLGTGYGHGRGWIDTRFFLPSAKSFCDQVIKADLNPVSFLKVIIKESGHPYLRRRFAKQCLVLYLSRKMRPESLTPKEVRSSLILSYGSRDFARSVLEQSVRKKDYQLMDSRLLAIVGDEDSLTLMSDWLHPTPQSKDKLHPSIRHLKHRLQIKDARTQESWRNEQLLFFQLEIAPDDRVARDNLRAVINGALRARYHGTEFSPEFLEYRLPEPMAIAYLGIQNERDSIPKLEELTKQTDLTGDVAKWALDTIADDGIPIGYKARLKKKNVTTAVPPKKSIREDRQGDGRSIVPGLGRDGDRRERISRRSDPKTADIPC